MVRGDQPSCIMLEGYCNAVFLQTNMNQIDLKRSLERPICPMCGSARIRPVDIEDGKSLMFDCSRPGCRWIGHAPLPVIRKKLIYLDTSTVSHIANALGRGDGSSPWIDLYKTLREATAAQVISCVVSSIVEDEIELSSYSAEKLLRIAKELKISDLKTRLEVLNAQVLRTLDAFLTGATPTLDTRPPSEDAFWQSPHRWLPVIRWSVNSRTPSYIVNSRRIDKSTTSAQIKQVYEEYSRYGDDFEAIKTSELRGFGKGLLSRGLRDLCIRGGIEAIPAGANPVEYSLPSTFDLVVLHLQQKLEIPYRDAFFRARQFLLSDHVALLPIPDIGSKLSAALAMTRRGPKPRPPKDSDLYDIDHLETYVPYVDIFIADRFFADLCNQKHLRIGKPYKTQIRKLGEGDMPKFIKCIKELTEQTPHARLAQKINDAIEKGGYYQEATNRIKQSLNDKN